MHESTIYLITLIELFVHIDCEKDSLRVFVTPQVSVHLNTINVPQLKLKENFEKLIQGERGK